MPEGEEKTVLQKLEEDGYKAEEIRNEWKNGLEALEGYGEEEELFEEAERIYLQMQVFAKNDPVDIATLLNYLVQDEPKLAEL